METLTMDKLNETVRLAYREEHAATVAATAAAPAPVVPEALAAPGVITPLMFSQLEAILLAATPATAPVVVPQAQDQPNPNANMEMMANPVMDVVKQLDGIAGQGMPWGSGLVGAGTGLVISEIVDGFSPPTGASVNFTNVGLKLGGAWVSAQFLPKVAGRTAGNISAGVLLFSVAREFAPIENGIQWIIAKLRGVVPQGNRFGQDYTTLALHQREFAPQFSNVVDSFANVLAPH